MREIKLSDARVNLSAVVDEAARGKPTVITRDGKRQAVIVSYEEWERLSRVPSFGRLLMAAGDLGDTFRRAQLEAVRTSGSSKAKAGPGAARSQDFLYGDDDGLPE
jgi:prevent-host-death family protein